MKEKRLLAEKALGGKVLVLAHSSTIVECMESPGRKFTKSEMLEAKLFDQYVNVQECYAVNAIDPNMPWFFTCDTPLGKIVYLADNYPCMFILQ